MIGCAFSDDEQQPTHKQTHTLPRWASITELSNLLDVSRNTISAAVKQAWANNEPWIKKEKVEDGNTEYYLIDTQHEIYLAHQERWAQHKTQRAPLVDKITIPVAHSHPGAGHAFAAHLITILAEASSPPNTPVWSLPNRRDGVLQRWPRFRQWLFSHGIQIFQNQLAEEGQKKPWAWRWADLHGEGYQSEEEAVIAALQGRLDANDAKLAESEYDAAFFHRLELQDLQESQQNLSWFKRLFKRTFQRNS